MINHQPPQLHVIIINRTDPPSPLPLSSSCASSSPGDIPESPSPNQIKSIAVLSELLTEREQTILRILFKTSLTSTEIANELVIAVSILRTHIKNIYSKLEVNNRLEVVARSHELGLD